MAEPRENDNTPGHGGDGSTETRELERRILMQIEQKQQRLHRIRWASKMAWVAFVLILVAGVAVEGAGGSQVISSTLGMVLRAVLLIALILTVSWYVRGVSCRFDDVQQALAAIHDRLDELKREK